MRAAELTVSVPPDLAPRIILQPIRLVLTRPVTDEDRDTWADAYAARYPREYRADALRAARHVLAGVDVSDTGHPRIAPVGVDPAPKGAFR
ncbi:hypothetical protein GCM10022200_05340 [Microbacterium awajiense]|uniref:Uncharacterized protein n=1 Tax=Microbacterium awajiense TaxID=415214 RepID=A0ABP7A6R0_9MICO